MDGQPCVWVVGPPEHWVSELLLRTELDIRCASVWADLESAGRSPDALIVTPRLQEQPGFGTVVSRYARVPLVLIDDEDGAFTYDAQDQSLVVHASHMDVILDFLATQLGVGFDVTPTQRRQLAALIRADDVSFVGRTVSFSERGLAITVPGLRLGLGDVEVALVTVGPCVRFGARVERHLRADGETHLGLVWRDIDATSVEQVLRLVARVEDGAVGSGATRPFETKDLMSEELPEWVQRALAGLASSGSWSRRVLQGRVETAIQLSCPVVPSRLASPTRDL